MSEPEEMRNGYRAYTAEELEAAQEEAKKSIDDAFWIGPRPKVKDPVKRVPLPKEALESIAATGSFSQREPALAALHWMQRAHVLLAMLAELGAAAIDMGDHVEIDRKDWERILDEGRLDADH